MIAADYRRKSRSRFNIHHTHHYTPHHYRQHTHKHHSRSSSINNHPIRLRHKHYHRYTRGYHKMCDSQRISRSRGRCSLMHTKCRKHDTQIHTKTDRTNDVIHRPRVRRDSREDYEGREDYDGKVTQKHIKQPTETKTTQQTIIKQRQSTTTTTTTTTTAILPPPPPPHSERYHRRMRELSYSDREYSYYTRRYNDVRRPYHYFQRERNEKRFQESENVSKYSHAQQYSFNNGKNSSPIVNFRMNDLTINNTQIVKPLESLKLQPKHERHSHEKDFQEGPFEDGSEEDEDSTGEDLEGLVMYKNVQTIYRERYSIVGKIGQGTFGTVLECYDNKREINVAVKIVRSVKKYLDAAELEIDILNKLDEYDIDNHSLIIPLYKAFRTHISGNEHACLVFKKCGLSLYDYIKKNNYRGFCLHEVIYIAYQMFHAIEFCHLNKLIHTDLKLENILFTSTRTINCYPQPQVFNKCKENSSHLIPDSLETRLIDFGGATFESDHHSSIINTRQYRGPEVIFGLSWSYPSDVWSIGCILAELCTGELLFQTHEDIEHLALMQKILQQTFSKQMINNALKKFESKKNENGLNDKRKSSEDLSVEDMFDGSRYILNWPQLAVDNKSVRYVDKCLTLDDLIDNFMMRDLILKCLQFDPNQRINARDAKKHVLFEKFAKIDLQFDELVKRLSTKKA